MLYIVPTPIGNLADMSIRAIEVLKSSTYILCEDTRQSIILLRRYEIDTPLKSFHKFSESHQEDKILTDLQSGLTVSLISDAGTPCIADPGYRLVAACREAQIPVTALPGPCAAITALSGSGFDSSLFQFVSFLPKKSQELFNTFCKILHYEGTSICYESPKRLLNTLKILHEMAPDRKLVIAREISKTFEEYQTGTAQELILYWREKSIKGEIVLLIAGFSPEKAWESWTEEEHVGYLIKTYLLSQRDAIKLAAQLRGVPKRDIYQRFLS